MKFHPSIFSAAVCAFSATMMSRDSFGYGYQLVINNTAPGAYYQNITSIGSSSKWNTSNNNSSNETTDGVEVIGGLYQDVLYDTKGNRVDHAIHQGYVIFSKEEGQENYNDFFYFEEEDDDDGSMIISTINVLNMYIMSANGTYAQYSGGTLSLNVLQYDPVYIAEVTLMEPPLLPSPTTTDANATMTFRVTNEGGWTEGINQEDPVGEDDVAIGLRFQDTILHPDGANNNSTVIGMKMGFLFKFPKLEGIDTWWNSNEQYNLHENNDGDGVLDGTILMLNDVIVYATGNYSQFVGGQFHQDIVPVSDQQPYFIADITVSQSTTDNTENPPSDNEAAAADDDDDDDDNDGSYNFIIKSEGGFFSSIDDVLTGDPIGERFQSPIIDPNGKQIGTNQGYGFKFPIPAAEFNLTTTLFQSNNRFFFHDGSIIDVFNDYIVSASGNYTKYQGGQLLQNVISDNPKWAAEVTLIPPKTKLTTTIDNSNDSNEEGEEEEEATSSSSFKKYNHYSFMVTVVAALYGYQYYA